MLVNHLIYKPDPSLGRQVQIKVVHLGITDFIVGVGCIATTVKPAKSL
jgi:hypothetical protein